MCYCYQARGELCLNKSENFNAKYPVYLSYFYWFISKSRHARYINSALFSVSPHALLNSSPSPVILRAEEGLKETAKNRFAIMLFGCRHAMRHLLIAFWMCSSLAGEAQRKRFIRETSLLSNLTNASVNNTTSSEEVCYTIVSFLVLS